MKEVKSINIFISYAHEDEFSDNIKFIKQIVNRLSALGFNVVFDQYDLELGNDIDIFMDKITKETTNFILVMCTPLYKEKVDNKIGGVYKEFERYRNFFDIPEQKSVIPIIIEDNKPNIIFPSDFPKNIFHIDLSVAETLENEFLNLSMHLRGIKEEKKPFSEFSALIHQINTLIPNSGIYDDVIKLAEKKIIKTVEVYKFRKYELGIWVDIGNALEGYGVSVENIVDFSSKISRVDLVYDFLYVLWEESRDYQRYGNSLIFVDYAIDLNDSNKHRKYYHVRKLMLTFQKAISLHFLDRLEEALVLYEYISDGEAKGIEYLKPEIVIESILYRGDINHLLGDTEKSIKMYKHITHTINTSEEIKHNIQIEVLILRAFNSLITISKTHSDNLLMESYQSQKKLFMEKQNYLSELKDFKNSGIDLEKPFYPPLTYMSTLTIHK